MKRNIDNLRRKLVMIEYAYNNLKKLQNNYFKRMSGEESRILNRDIEFFAEAFFYQVKSFLDLYIKYIIRKKYCKKDKQKKRYKNNKVDINFNFSSLERITPQTSFIKFLKKQWNEGYKRKKYSLKVFIKYRNYICHEASLTWFDGHVNSNKIKFHMLPDSLNYKKQFTCKKNINLFELCNDVFESLKDMCSKFDSKTKYTFK